MCGLDKKYLIVFVVSMSLLEVGREIFRILKKSPGDVALQSRDRSTVCSRVLESSLGYFSPV